jgi:hypothetical protein
VAAVAVTFDEAADAGDEALPAHVKRAAAEISRRIRGSRT